MAGQWLQQGGNIRQSGAALVPGPLGTQPLSGIVQIPFSAYFGFGSGGPVVDAGGTVFFADKQNLRAIDANGDDLPWSPWVPSLPGDSLSFIPAQPCLDSRGNIYFLSQSNLYVLTSGGTTSWTYGQDQDPNFSAPCGSPLIDDTGTIYCFNNDMAITALTSAGASNKILRQLWKTTLTPTICGNPSLGSVSVRGEKTDFVYCVTGFQLAALYRAGARAGQLAWTFDFRTLSNLIPPFAAGATVIPTSAAVVGVDGTLYIAVTDANLNGGIVALTPGLNNAERKWLFIIPDAVNALVSPPAVSPLGSIFFCWWARDWQGSLHTCVQELEAGTGIASVSSPYLVPASDSVFGNFSQPTIGVDGTCYIGCGGKSCIYAIRPGGDQPFSLAAPVVIDNPINIYPYYIGNSLAIGPEDTIYALLTDGTHRVSGAVASWGVSLFIFHVDCDGKQITVQWVDEENSGTTVCHLINVSGVVISSQSGIKRAGLGYETTFEADLSTGGLWQVKIVDGSRNSAAATVITEAPTLTTCTFDAPTLTINWSNSATNARRMMLELTPVSGNGRTRHLDLGLSSPGFAEVFLPRTVQYQATLRAATRVSFGPKSNAVTIAGRWLPAPTVVPTALPSATANGNRTLGGTVALTGSSDDYGVKIYHADGLKPGAPLPSDYRDWQTVSDLINISEGRWSTPAPLGQYFAASLVELDYTNDPSTPSAPSVGLGAVFTTGPFPGRLPRLAITGRPFATEGLLTGAVINLDGMPPANQSTYWIIATYQNDSGQWLPTSKWKSSFQGYCKVQADGTWSIIFPKPGQPVSASAFAAMLVAGPAGAEQPPATYTGWRAPNLPTVDYHNVLGTATTDPMAGTITMTLPPYSDGGIVAGNITYIPPETSELVILGSANSSGPWTQVNAVRCFAALNGNWATNVTASAYYAAIVIPRPAAERGPKPPALTYPALPALPTPGILAVTPAQQAATRPQPRALALNMASDKSAVLQYMKVPSLPLDGPVFSIECWVRPILPGCILSWGAATASSAGLSLEVQAGGILDLRLALTSGALLVDLKSNPSDLLDGSWHHVAVVRSLLGIALYLDGKPAASQEFTAAQNAGRQLASGGTLYIGANAALTTPPDNRLVGALQDLRVWTWTIEPSQIVTAMYQRLSGPESGLAGHWSFDNSSMADSSGNDCAATLVGSPGFTADAVTLVRAGEPYLVTQATLMEDYAGSSTNPQEITSYRIVVKAHSGNTGAMQTAVQIAVVAPDLEPPASGSPTPTPPPYPSGTIIVQGPNGFLAPTATATTPYVMPTDPTGELSFCIQANTDYLLCPLVKVRAEFMGQDEWLVISPDRQLQGHMTTLTGGQLNQMVQKSTGTSPELDADGAEAVARSVRNLGATACEHDLESSHPVVRSQAVSQAAAKASDGQPGDQNSDVDTALPPTERRYQNGAVTRSAYMPGNNVIAADFAASDDSVARIASAEAMPDQEFMVNWSRDGQPVFSSDVTLIQGERGKAKSLSFASDPLTKLLLTGSADAPIPRAAYLAALHASAGPQALSFNSFRNFLKNAKGFIVSTVKRVIEETKQIVSHVVLAAKNALDELEHWVVTTAEQAIGAIQGLLEKISVKIKEVIAFFKEIFNWGDILVSQQVCQQELQKIIPRVTTFLRDFKPQISGQFDKWRAKIDNAFTQLDQTLAGAGHTLAGQNLQAAQMQSAAAGPTDIRSAYLVQMAKTGAAGPVSIDYSPGLGGKSSSSTAFFTAFEQLSPQLETFATTVGESGLLGALVNPQSISSGSLGVFTEIVRTLLNAVKTVVDAGINLAKAVVAKLVDFVIEILQLLDGMLSAHMQIPIVTPLYEKVIMRGHGQLTAYSLVSLLAAVPFTVAYKASHNGVAPFPNSSRKTQVIIEDAAFATQAADAPGASVAPHIISQLQGYGLAFSTLFYAPLAIINDIAGLEKRESDKRPGLALSLEAAVWLFTVPWMSMDRVSADKDNAKKADALDIALWCVQFFAVFLDGVEVSDKIPSKVIEKLKPAAVGIVGIISLGLAIPLWVFDGLNSTTGDGSVVAAGFSNLFSILPQLGQFAKYAPKAYSVPIVFCADATGYFIWFGITLVRAAVLEDEHIFNPRRANKGMSS